MSARPRFDATYPKQPHPAESGDKANSSRHRQGDEETLPEVHSVHPCQRMLHDIVDARLVGR
jgi:hypothetical protein